MSIQVNKVYSTFKATKEKAKAFSSQAAKKVFVRPYLAARQMRIFHKKEVPESLEQAISKKNSLRFMKFSAALNQSDINKNTDNGHFADQETSSRLYSLSLEITDGAAKWAGKSKGYCAVPERRLEPVFALVQSASKAVQRDNKDSFADFTFYRSESVVKTSCTIGCAALGAGLMLFSPPADIGFYTGVFFIVQATILAVYSVPFIAKYFKNRNSLAKSVKGQIAATLEETKVVEKREAA